MSETPLNVLLVVEQCNPEWASVPLVGYNFYHHVSALVQTTLVTHERNRDALERVRGDREIVYIGEGKLTAAYYKLVERIATRGRTNWPLLHALGYPVYAEFNRKTARRFGPRVRDGAYDVVHALTPILPRYPVKLSRACGATPFILGPVNGGIPFPPGFAEVARQESAHFNFLRQLGRRLLPGYARTYRQATRVLAGSTYTGGMLQEMFGLDPARVELMHENGVPEDFVLAAPPQRDAVDRDLELLFVGRLVPYKGCDMVLDAMAELVHQKQVPVKLTVVGDGPDRETLQETAAARGLGHRIKFTGWISHAETLEYYRSADIFCFPSVREFGGAVALEAMANGLPCVVVDHGGIAEYVTDQTGFRIPPQSRDFVVQELVRCTGALVADTPRRRRMSEAAIARAREYAWPRKAARVAALYREAVGAVSQHPGGCPGTT